MANLDINLKSDYFVSIDNQTLTLGQAILLLTREHDEIVAHDTIRKYCLETESEKFQRVGLEYLYINGHYSDLEVLIIKNKASINILNHQWADVFQILLDRRLNRDQAHIFLSRLKQIRTEDPELLCLIELAKVAFYNDMNLFGEIGHLLEMQSRLFNRIEDDFILSSCKLRLYQHLFVYYWVRNELIMARKFAFRALNETNSPLTKASLHVNLGLTYTFDTYQQGMYHFNEAMKIAKKHHLELILQSLEIYNIPFISAHFKQIDKITTLTTSDRSEQAHIEIAKGNTEQAIHILKEVSIDSPFKLYYLGLAMQDEAILEKAYTDFIEKRSDYFFSRLPFNALKKLRAERQA